MSASNVLESDLLELIFHKTQIPGLEGTDSDVFIALHTADPGEAGTQATSEANFTGYARLQVARTVGQWTVAGSLVSNAAELAYSVATAGNNSITHVSLGRSDGVILLYGALSQTLAVSAGVTPKFAAGQLQFTAN